MKKFLLGLCVTTILLFAVSASAQNKVIVVPLGGSSNSASSSGDSWIRIYDNNSVFIGFSLDRYFIISANKYFTSINYNTSEGVYHYEPLGVFNCYYLSADCSGNPYGSTESYPSTLPLRGAGQVATTYSPSYAHFYIPLNATPVTIPVGTTISAYDFSGACGSSILTESKDLFEFLPNDPNVTGFPNTIAVPLNAVYTLPTSP